MKRRSDPLFCGPVVASPPGGQFLAGTHFRSEEHTSELQSQSNLVCRLLLEKKKKIEEKVSFERKIYLCVHLLYTYYNNFSSHILHINTDPYGTDITGLRKIP